MKKVSKKTVKKMMAYYLKKYAKAWKTLAGK